MTNWPFPKNICNVYTVSHDTNADGTPIKSVLYANIECQVDLVKINSNVNSSEISSNTDIDAYDIFLEPDKVWIKKGDYIDIYNIHWSLLWNYQVEYQEAIESITWYNDHVYILARKYE